MQESISLAAAAQGLAVRVRYAAHDLPCRTWKERIGVPPTFIEPLSGVEKGQQYHRQPELCSLPKVRGDSRDGVIIDRPGTVELCAR